MANRAQWIEALSRGNRTGHALPAPWLVATLDLLERYARVEKIVQGSTRVRYSQVGLEIDTALDPRQQGTCLALAERRRLDMPSGPLLELAALVEEQGIKVVRRAFPRDSPALGGFLFVDELGPAIVVNARASASEAVYALARHYGHFLADFDPYITIVSPRPDPTMLADPMLADPMLADPIEARAHGFALEFLMPQADIDMYADAMQIDRHSGATSELVQQLAAYFELDVEIILWQLLALGWLDGERLRALLQTAPHLAAALRSAPPDIEDGASLVPERLIRLVAHAFGKGKLDLEDAEQLLGLSTAETEHLLHQFHFEDRVSPRTPKSRMSVPEAR